MSDIIQPIAIGSDHAGYEYKAEIIRFLEEKGFQVKDMGVYENKPVDYPDFAHPVAYAVEKKRSFIWNISLRFRERGCNYCK